MKSLFEKIIFMFILSACMIVNIHADNLNESGSRNITATIKSIEEPMPVYDYDITWGNMNFVYTTSEEYVFNSTTNEYDKILRNSWASNSNSIEVVNNSSLSINVSLSYVSSEDSVTGRFSSNSFVLSQSESKKTYLNLSGSLNSNYTNYTKVGSILMEVE